MKYSVQIICAIHGAHPAFEISAADDNLAVDKARKKHEVPEEGGKFTMVVTCLEPLQVYSAEARSMVERPANFEVSRFELEHEPQPQVAEAVYARREADKAAAEEAAKVAKIRADTLAEFGLDESGNKVK